MLTTDGNTGLMLNTEEKTDWAALIEAARGGCDVALGRMLSDVRSYLVAIAESQLGARVRSKFDASDVVQIGMFEAHSGIREFRGESELEFRRWLKRIVITSLQDEARRYTHTHSRSVQREVDPERSQMLSQHSHSETASWCLSRSEVDQQLAIAVGRLPDRQRYVIEARHRDGLNYAEIAAQLKITEAGARKIWSRATDRLNAALKANV